MGRVRSERKLHPAVLLERGSSGITREAEERRLPRFDHRLAPTLLHPRRNCCMYALSTCWNSHRHTDGRAMLREIRDLGFQFAELSHGIRLSLLPGIIESVEAGDIKISSLHNFCPLPMGVNYAAPNLYQFSAERPRERDLAERYTLKTIELAARVKALLVVLHSGSLDMKDYTDKLLDLVARGERNTSKYEKLCAEFTKKRDAKKEPVFERVKEMFKKILPEAESRDVKLGVENRQALEELPIETDY